MPSRLGGSRNRCADTAPMSGLPVPFVRLTGSGKRWSDSLGLRVTPEAGE